MTFFIGPIFSICVYWLLVKAMGRGLPFYGAALIFVPITMTANTLLAYGWTQSWILPGLSSVCVSILVALGVFFFLDYLDGQESDNASVLWSFALIIGGVLLLVF